MREKRCTESLLIFIHVLGRLIPSSLISTLVTFVRSISSGCQPLLLLLLVHLLRGRMAICSLVSRRRQVVFAFVCCRCLVCGFAIFRIRRFVTCMLACALLVLRSLWRLRERRGRFRSSDRGHGRRGHQKVPATAGKSLHLKVAASVACSSNNLCAK